MTPDEQRFMALEGIVQWAFAVTEQANRIESTQNHLLSIDNNQRDVRMNILRFHTECHYFSISAFKFIEMRRQCRQFGLCESVDFSEIDAFSFEEIRDLRNMREHVWDYFTGAGRAQGRWFIDTPNYRADASSVVGTQIGGRLDWVAFSRAVGNILPQLIAEPVPYPRYE